jgi:hypothetical protein
MDPQTAWRRMLDACSRQDGSDATAAAEDLLSWLRGGGFPPQTLPDRRMDDAFNRVMASAACQFMLSRFSSETA